MFFVPTLLNSADSRSILASFEASPSIGLGPDVENGEFSSINLESPGVFMTKTSKHRFCDSSTWKRDFEDLRRRPRLDTIHEQTLQPQFGLEVLTFSQISVEMLAKYANVDVPDLIVRELEGVFLLLLTLSQQTTTLGITSAVLGWASGRCSRSMCGMLEDFIGELFVTPQSANDSPDWLVCLRDMYQNWQLCRNNRFFKQISKLLGCVVFLGLCDASSVTFELGKFKIIAPDLCEKHATAWDLADAVFETIMFFTEGAYMCFQTGSLQPLLVNDRTAMELDTEYAQVISWFDLVRNGNLKKFAEISDQEFERRLNRLSTSLQNLSTSLKGIDKKLVLDKFQKILSIQNDYVAMKVASGVRHSPWAVELFGESSQGKTTLGDQLLDAVMTSQGMPLDKEYRCAYNPSDKFMSNWTSDKLVMIFDDVANAKSQFVEKPPTEAIIDVINNQMYYAPKAELEAKGKCFVEPWITLATTNKKDLDAGMYSNCPYSIQRRLVCVTVRAKREFQIIENGIACGIDSKKVREHYTIDGVYTPPMFDDIWTVDIERAVMPRDLKNVATYEPINWRGRKMVNVSMAECIQWAIEDFNEHKLNQEALLSGMKCRSIQMVKCSHPGCIHLEGNCPDHAQSYCATALEPHFGASTFGAVKELWFGINSPVESFKSSIETYRARADKETAEYILDKGRTFLSSCDWIKIVPKCVVDDEHATMLFKWMYKDKITKNYSWEKRRLFFTLVMSQVALFTILPTWLAVTAMLYSLYKYTATLKSLLVRVEEDVMQDLRVRNMEIAPILREYRDRYSKHLCAGAAGLAILYCLAKSYGACRRYFEKKEEESKVDEEGKPVRKADDTNKVLKDDKKVEAKKDCKEKPRPLVEDETDTKDSVHQPLAPQGTLAPKTLADVTERDSETNQWASIIKRCLPISDASKRMSCDQLSNVVRKNLLYGTLYQSDGTRGAMNGFMLTSNVILLPYHYFLSPGDELKVDFRKKNPEASGGKFTARIHEKFSVMVPGTDLCLCYSPNGGSFKNVVDYFPTGDLPPTPFRLYWRARDGDFLEGKGISEPGMVTTNSTFPGGMYKNLTMTTFDGMCGATVVSDTNGSTILGMHLGGTAGTPVGCYGSLTQSQIHYALTELRKKEGVVLSGGAGVFNTTVLGVQVLREDPLHKKSALNYLPEHSQIEYYGSCPGRTVNKSDVRVTPISEHIINICNAPNIYCGPKFNPDWYGWQACLANMAIPAHPYPHDLLELAIRDYKSGLIDIFKSDLWSNTRPLTDHENLCGVPGKKFLDAIKLDTSIGFPLSGPKREYVTELEPTSECPNNRELDSVIVEEIKRIEDLYRKGERGYPIAKACKKDEILTKEKCRIFFGNAISLTFLIRKYFLPLLRILQMNPLMSECAVGINSHGPEWDELHQHVTKHGMNRLFGGDYGKYDQKLPSQLLFAALRIMIDFARVCDYSEDDISVMEAMTGDIVFAYIAFNGDLIGLTEGTHISGNSLTVIINGICGSLNLRCYFYHEYRPMNFEDRLDFREYISLMTYGDDNTGSVHESIDRFTIKGCSEFLAQYGQVYTMPDKKSELLDFLPPDQFEFLKRKSVWHPALKCHVGALIDESIYKSLHCYMRGKNCVDTPEYACAQNIDGALREWFNHGKEKYEIQVDLMQRVAEAANITHLCTGLSATYEERVEDWFAKYS
jgi:hypothetical protein